MSTINPIGSAKPQELSPQDARLLQTARKLEGVFVEQLFKVMRETVPEGGLVDGGTGEEVFAGMLDQHLADEVPSGWNRGLSDAVYRQLRNALSPEQGTQSIDPAGKEARP